MASVEDLYFFHLINSDYPLEPVSNNEVYSL